MSLSAWFPVYVTDSIEANVEHATIHVEEGTKQLSKARDYQVRSRSQGTHNWNNVHFTSPHASKFVYLV